MNTAAADITHVASRIDANASVDMRIYLWEPHPDAPGEWEVLGQYGGDDEAIAEILADAPDGVSVTVGHDDDGFARIHICETVG